MHDMRALAAIGSAHRDPPARVGGAEADGPRVVSLDRDRVPAWQEYAEREGLTLHGRGKWRNVLCDFHADTDPSMRVNTESGGWVCMSCGASGGDTLSHYMQRHGADFIDAARALGAWTDAASPAHQRPRTLSARDGLSLLHADAMVLFVVGSDIGAGKTPPAKDLEAVARAVRRILVVYEGVSR
jgi:hypothetical protein